ncbi:putative polyketide synthase [Xylogone sp. PMI_703]|nr:putative polyketide synthase [Xylogone sp. PMI_703]
MAGQILSNTEGNTVLVFGPQILSFEDTSFRRLSASISRNASQQWIVDTISELPDYWETLCRKFPKLVDVRGGELLKNLNLWFKAGTMEQQGLSHLPNILLSPLVVITQLTEYMEYLRVSNPKATTQDDLFTLAQPNTETLGFCTGLLSAIVISCSTNEMQFREYGAVAIRLAVLTGALVDAQDEHSEYGESRTLATIWKSPESAAEMTRILQSFPEAYISVRSDENRASVTTSKETISALKQQLKEADIVATEIGLRGRFHSQSYHDDFEELLSFCGTHPAFSFPDASKLVLPTRSTISGDYITKGCLHDSAARAILLEQCRWYQTFSQVQSSRLDSKDSRVITFGPERCIPSSLVRGIKSTILHSPSVYTTAVCDSRGVINLGALAAQRPYSDNDIAVIGMSCKIPGADDLEEFWDILVEAKSQHTEVPKERFGFKTTFRDADANRKWYGNFLSDVDAFDHKFFKKSPREAATMDPQQRLLMQTAYQAVQQSGYFRAPKSAEEKHIGVYIGTCATDYENNIACHPANAFSATGNLRSFIAGKISHYFGWTGPGLTVDTACSASFVAIHQACKDILSGDCTAALAGGTNIMTQPLWFQNLAAASFLSPTGQCKPFDAAADGYCRGEAIGVVFLKKMSAAVADGDIILGTIAATGVQQNENCTPIFVPNVPSLSNLFQNVINKSGIESKQISVVEAHGTGTPVGDPAEFDSIRKIFGGIPRSVPLQLGSVKGLVGHTESSSGVISLLKILLMINKGYIPPQPSFNKINPSINLTKADNIDIPTSLTPWNETFRAALINNYGASGSNASMIVAQAPQLKPETVSQTTAGQPSENISHPFWFSGVDERSILAYVAKFRQYLKSNVHDSKNLSVADLSFNLSRQSNRLLDRALILSSSSIEDLDQKLAAFENGDKTLQITTPQPSRPVILCFGGQISTFVGLDRQVFDNIAILRHYLDECDATCRSLGVGSIYPDIFQNTPIQNVIKLQTCLFAMQYASAKSWIDCGIQPVALVGHSFGELTAVCISGALSLVDALRMIIGRATIIRDSWGPEKGSMMAVEGDLAQIEGLLAASGKLTKDTPATIACYNGPRSFTLAGSAEAIDAVAQAISTDATYSSLRYKKLNVTNAYHSTLVEPLFDDLERIGRELTFNQPKLPLERSTEARSTETLTSRFVPEHMRYPVYFNHAVQRLRGEYPSCIWLEAGSNSTITNMAGRALGTPKDSHFQPINITSGQALQQLTDATTNLWKAGLRVSHWAHSAEQRYQYGLLLLPPYQFDKQRHWMEFKEPPQFGSVIQQTQSKEDIPTTLWTFMGYQDGKQRNPRFRINTTIKKYEDIVSGHLIAQTASICPATLMVDMVIEAAMSLHPEFATSGFAPQIRNVVNLVPICNDPSKLFWLDLEPHGSDAHTWQWKYVSNGKQDAATTTHATGEIAFRSIDDAAYQLEFGRFERLVDQRRCLEILEHSDPDEVIQGRGIYKIFSDVVDYGEMYFGLRKLVGKGNESAGYVVKKHSGQTWLDPFLGDCFSQVGGIWVNCMTDKNPGDMFIANGFEQWVRSPKLLKNNDYRRPESWHVLARHNKAASGNSYLTDIFIFDSATGVLSEAILGIQYAKVAKLSMSKILSRLSSPGSVKSKGAQPETVSPIIIEQSQSSHVPSAASQLPQPSAAQNAGAEASSPGRDLIPKLKEVLAEISGLEIHEIKNDVELADLGIDSLLGMEMANEIESVFECTLSTDELMTVTDFPGLLRCLQSALGIVPGDSSPQESETTEPSSSDERADLSDTPASTLASSSAASVVDNKSETSGDLDLPGSVVLEAFGESKLITDQFIADYKCTGYMNTVMPRQTQLCVALTVEAFEQLGCDLKSAKPGQKLERIPHLPEHGRLADYLYTMLDETRIIDIDGEDISRTAVPVPSKSSESILKELERDYPDHTFANQLSFWTGSKLAEVLSGKTDGLKLIFATEKGRELVSGLYGDSHLNKLAYKQMADFLSRLSSKLEQQGHEGTVKILEMGAGTGGTTKWLVPLLAGLGMTVEYTYTDLSPSFVAAARKRFREYPFMKFRVHDIEKAPADDLLHSQHIVIASNAIHATHSLTESTKNIHKMLRPDGFLMMLEMTQTLYWVDVIFGVFEGWWLFDDGRKHALAHQSRWDKELQSAGYGHVDWTDGHSPEVNIQRVFVALASGPRFDRLPIAAPPVKVQPNDFDARRAATDEYIRKSTLGFSVPASSKIVTSTTTCVLVTGATGSLGSHIVAYLANLPNVDAVICLNRRGNTEPQLRQLQALESRGIHLDEQALSKLKVLESDTSKPLLGLSEDKYEVLLARVSHIIHNAWPMSGKLPLQGFKLQFEVMRNFINLAAQISSRRPKGFKVGFQLVSSIATVGYYPLRTGNAHIPEERMTIESVLPNGYGDAKFVCERMLDETLLKHPDKFRTMSVRLGQVAGSSKSGYWNHMEHFSFLVKSSQTLKALPDFDGVLSWTPVDLVAASLGDLVVSDTEPHPIYHIDNPVRQPWKEMTAVLADALQIPRDRIIPFGDWIRRVRSFPGPVEWDNPAAKLVDFLEDDFVRMSCGGVLLDTTKVREHSETMRNVGPVGADVTKRYIQAWKDSGFLHN